MNHRADAIAARIEQGVAELAALVEGLTEAEWAMVVPNEERPIGVLVHHVASSYPVEVDLASTLAAGKPIEGVTSDVIDGINADHAAQFAKVAKEDVLKLLKEKQMQLIDSEPRIGAGGHKIAFLHPKSTFGVLTELCEH